MPLPPASGAHAFIAVIVVALIAWAILKLAEGLER